MARSCEIKGVAFVLVLTSSRFPRFSSALISTKHGANLAWLFEIDLDFGSALQLHRHAFSGRYQDLVI
jgi:hypothetical protein